MRFKKPVIRIYNRNKRYWYVKKKLVVFFTILFFLLLSGLLVFVIARAEDFIPML
ncbi:MAG: hypothetical protein IJ867_07805 [Clostridia bacterium]|nr:hypothetical protein [Clostridia bacterium]